MTISIVCVGKLKEKYLRDAVSEYEKRLSRYATVKILEAEDERTDVKSEAEALKVKEIEGQRILKLLPKDCYVVALDLRGKQMTSEQLSDNTRRWMELGRSNVAYIIGGSLGLSKEVLDRADYKLKFSEMTFPHQLMRVILLEQLYRAEKIARNESYHK